MRLYFLKEEIKLWQWKKKKNVSELLHEWQLSYTKAVFFPLRFVQKPFLRVFVGVCRCDVVPACEKLRLYQASQQSKQNFDLSDNEFGTACLFGWAAVFFFSANKQAV